MFGSINIGIIYVGSTALCGGAGAVVHLEATFAPAAQSQASVIRLSAQVREALIGFPFFFFSISSSGSEISFHLCHRRAGIKTTEFYSSTMQHPGCVESSGAKWSHLEGLISC